MVTKFQLRSGGHAVLLLERSGLGLIIGPSTSVTYQVNPLIINILII
jgi:hypothetical protein